MSRYRQLAIEERCSIARLHEDGQSNRQIAAALDRQPSTIAREVKRNSGTKVGYQPASAQAQANARRWLGTRLEPGDASRAGKRVVSGKWVEGRVYLGGCGMMQKTRKQR